ncbi:hypothetical protein BDN70DRAFT_939597 [Pholiota conissans]|uniref:Uncharacterized protein n=1 Tax=Pholiota conissans TaxID=109636 RepID=A0A9P5YKF6_9AGAR|nr:hypothetical protein BDN70DRAFT_939597 [Pholiota conissans]
MEAEFSSKAKILDALAATSKEKQLQTITAQGHIQALEHELTLKSQAVDTLTTDTEQMQSQIDALTADLRTSVAVSINLEEEHDTAQLSMQLNWKTRKQRKSSASAS